MKQTLPFTNKVLPEADMNKVGKTDHFFRFSDKKKLGDWVVRQQSNPRGDIYKDTFTPELVKQRKEALKLYASKAEKHGIQVVPHTDFVAALDKGDTPGLWQAAKRINGRSLHDIFKLGDPLEDAKALPQYEKVIAANCDYLLAASEAGASAIVTDLAKPSQYMVDGENNLVMVDTNPPLWTTPESIDSEASGLLMDSVAVFRLYENLEPLEQVLGLLQTMEDRGEPLYSTSQMFMTLTSPNLPPEAVKLVTDVFFENDVTYSAMAAAKAMSGAPRQSSF